MKNNLTSIIIKNIGPENIVHKVVDGKILDLPKRKHVKTFFQNSLNKYKDQKSIIQTPIEQQLQNCDYDYPLDSQIPTDFQPIEIPDDFDPTQYIQPLENPQYIETQDFVFSEINH